MWKLELYVYIVVYKEHINHLYNDQYKAKYTGKKLIMTLCALYTRVCVYMYTPRLDSARAPQSSLTGMHIL